MTYITRTNQGWGRKKPPQGARLDYTHPHNRGVAGYLALTEPGGKTLHDLSLKLGTVTTNNLQTRTRTPQGLGLNFVNASSQYANINNLPRFAGDFTFEFIFSATSTAAAATGRLTDDWSAGGGFNYICYISTNVVGFQTGSGGGSTGSTTLAISYNRPYHVFMVRAGLICSIYLWDLTTGAFTQASYTASGAGAASSNTRYLGADTNASEFFDGYMVKAAFYSTAKSLAECTNIRLNPWAGVLAPPLQLFGTAIAAPAAPTSLAATNAVNPVLTWTAATGSPTAYIVLRSTVSGSGYSTIATLGVVTTYTDITAVAGQTYYYVVQASNSGGTSANSNEASAYTQPTAPTSVAGQSGNGSVTLKAVAATGGGTITYTVQQSTTQGSGYSTVLSGQTNPASLTVTGLTNGTKYYFIVLAVNAAGTSTASNEGAIIPVAGSGGTGASASWSYF